MEFQTAYSREIKSVTVFNDEHMTEQAHKDTTDINRILKDYQKTGFIAHAKKHEGQYDDVSSMDFEKAMATVANVKSMFEGLPSTYREQFGNNPTNFLQFVQNPQNTDTLKKMGILKGNDGFDIHGAATLAPVEAKAASAALGAEQGAATAAASPDSSESDTGASTAPSQ